MTKVKIPKRVAGVKIPKKVRKKAKKALKMAESPMVREAAVMALGAVGGAKAVKDGSNGHGPRGPVRIDGETLRHAIGEAALDGIRRFLEGFEEGLRKASAAAGDAAEAVDERASEDEDERAGDDEEERARRPAADAVVD